MRNELSSGPELMTLPELIRSTHFRLSFIILLGISILTTQIPLLNYLGYEFSVAVALVLSVASGLITLALFRRLHASGVVTLSAFMNFQRNNLYLNLILLLVPFFVITLNIVEVKNCSYLEGVAFYGLIPLVTLLFSIALASACYTLFRRPSVGYFAVLVVVGLLHPLWLGYSSPQIYSYNFLYGFFPGLSYDEVLTVTPTLILFRLITLIAALWLFLLARFFVQRMYFTDRMMAKRRLAGEMIRGGLTKQKAIIFGLLFALVCTWVFRIDLGLESSSSSIREKLGSVFRTEHFAIYYAKDSFSGDEIRWVAAEHEFRFHQVVGRLQVVPNRIESYIYPTEEMKRDLIGSGTTNIAKPWRSEIHLNADSWQRVLKHELVHVLAGEFGMPVIRANFRVGLVEGLAMAVEWDFGNRTLHEYAAGMRRFGLMRDVGSLMSLTGFAAQASSVSYVLCGSFCRFLIDRYGMVRFKGVYGGKSFPKVYGKDTAALLEEWDNFLIRIPIPDEWSSHFRFYFDRRSIFAKECARYIAKLNSNALRQLRRRNFAQAMQLYGTSLAESWNSEAFSGLIRTAYAAGRYDIVVGSIDEVLSDPVRNTTVKNLLLLYGDALWSQEDVLSARKAYEECLTLDLSESLNEAAAVRSEAIEDPLLRFRIQPVFLGGASDSDNLSFLERLEKTSGNPIISFLRANMLFRMQAFDRTRKTLDGSRVESKNPFLARILNAYRERLFGMSSFRLRDFQRARVNFWQAMNFTANQASLLRLHDWIDRCEWFAANAPKYLDSR